MDYEKYRLRNEKDSKGTHAMALEDAGSCRQLESPARSHH